MNPRDENIKEFAREIIRENPEEYFDGYTAITPESIEEVVEAYYDEFCTLYKIEKKENL